MWYAVRYETCRNLLRDPRLGHDEEKLFRRPGMTEAQMERMRQRMEKRRRRGFSMLTENPPDHTRIRRLVSRAFTTPRVESLRERVAGLVDERLDELAEAGEVDVMQTLAFPLPVTVIGEMVGVPESERERFRPLITEGMLADRPDATEEEMAKAEANFEELEQFFTDLIVARRAAPEDDLLSALIAVRDEEDGRLDDDELRSTVFLLFFAGFVTTTNVIGNGLLALFRHPSEMARLWADGSLVETAVEEILRFDGPVPFVLRDVLEPLEVEDESVALEKGDHVVMMLAAANRDPERFPDPDRLDVGRRDSQPLSFGWGIHHCLGAPLARLEAQMVFARLRNASPASSCSTPTRPGWSASCADCAHCRSGSTPGRAGERRGSQSRRRIEGDGGALSGGGPVPPDAAPSPLAALFRNTRRCAVAPPARSLTSWRCSATHAVAQKRRRQEA